MIPWYMVFRSATETCPVKRFIGRSIHQTSKRFRLWSRVVSRQSMAVPWLSRLCQTVSITAHVNNRFPMLRSCTCSLLLRISRRTGSSVIQPAIHIGKTSEQSTSEIGNCSNNCMVCPTDSLISGTARNI
jgi:hypothetical protein